MFKGHVTKESQVFFKDYKNMYINNVEENILLKCCNCI